MKFCEHCGHQNEDNFDFCANCGISLGPQPYFAPQGQGQTTKSAISDFFYLIYCVVILIISAVVMGILYLIFGFWIELINYIIWAIIIFGCISQVFVAFFDWIGEKRELKKKRKKVSEVSEIQ